MRSDQVPPDRLELSFSAPEADALSTELRGRTQGFYPTVEQITNFITR
jgi:hypothetical protein